MARRQSTLVAHIDTPQLNTPHVSPRPFSPQSYMNDKGDNTVETKIITKRLSMLVQQTPTVTASR
eukprot:3102511-Amphidinium_carterae.1